MTDVLKSVIVNLIEMVCCKLFFDIFCVRGSRQKWKEILIVAATAFVIFGTAVVLQGQMMIKAVVVTGIMALMMRRLYRELSVARSIAVALLYMGLVAVMDFLSLVFFETLYVVCGAEDPVLFENMMLLCSKSLLMFGVILTERLIDRNNIKYLGKLQWAGIVFFPVFATVMVIMTVTETWGHEIDHSYVFLVLAFGLVSVTLGLFCSIRDMAWKNRRLHEAAMIGIQTQGQLELYERIMADTERLRKLSHDYNAQLSCIQTLCETENYTELRKYLKRINGSLHHDLDRIDTNHAVVNAVLNARYEEALQKGILFICKIDDMSGIRVNSQDIVVLLANILNNAIEACEKCRGDKYIKFKMVQEGDQLILSERNSYNGEMRYDNGDILTTKTDNRQVHGIGMKNIRQVVEKYDGYYSIRPEEKEFYIAIVLPQ